MFQFQALSARRFQSGFDRVDLHRPTRYTSNNACAQGLTLVHFSAYRGHFCGICWVLSFIHGVSMIDKNGSGWAEKWTSVRPCLRQMRGVHGQRFAERVVPRCTAATSDLKQCLKAFLRGSLNGGFNWAPSGSSGGLDGGVYFRFLIVRLEMYAGHIIVVASSAETKGTFNTGFDTVNLHDRPAARPGPRPRPP